MHFAAAWCAYVRVGVWKKVAIKSYVSFKDHRLGGPRLRPMAMWRCSQSNRYSSAVLSLANMHYIHLIYANKVQKTELDRDQASESVRKIGEICPLNLVR